MNAFTYLKAGHLLGVILWLGPIICTAFILSRKNAETSGGQAALATAIKPSASIADWGALLAIGCGVGLIIVSKSLGDAWAMKQGWMHIKLILVLVLIGFHGVYRAGIRRVITGKATGLAGWLFPATILLAAAILYLVVVRPL